jgi:guanylate kinase
MPELVILSGPSCAGKSPLFRALRQLYPQYAQNCAKLVLFNDRAPRPGEEEGRDYYFRSRHEIEELRGRKDYLVIEVRNDLQAVHLPEIREILDSGKNAFYEGAPYVAGALRNEPSLKDITKVSVFLSPLSREEIQFFSNPELRVDLNKMITSLMRKKLLRRKRKQIEILSLPDLEDIETRCSAAFRELQEAWKFDYVIPNHDGEDSGNWTDFHYPIGEARKAVHAFASILMHQPLPWVEKWEKHLIQEPSHLPITLKG